MQGRIKCLAFATAAVIASTCGAQAARAALLTTDLTVPLTGSTVSVNLGSPLGEAVLGGNTQLLDEAGDVACPAGRQLSAAVPPASLAGDVACVVGALDYQVLTRLNSPTGPIVRTHAAVVNLPTPINVDMDLVPDVLVTLQVLALDKFTLRVERLLGEVAPLPMSLEALVDDPTGGVLPREHINAGFDARGSVTPTSWTTTATLPEDGDDNLTTIDTSTAITGGGAAITTLGGMFDGEPLARRDPLGGRLKYTPAPPNATLGLSLGTFLEVRAGSSIPTLVNGDVEIVDGPREQRARVDVLGLPRSLVVRNVRPAEDQRTVTYAASAAVTSIDATYRDTLAGTLISSALVRARILPLGMTLKQTAARVATFEATSPLGSVEVGYGAGREPVLLPVDHPYARVVEDSRGKSYAGRIDELLRASVDATDDVVAELELGPGGRKPLRALVEVPEVTIDGRVSNLPRHTKVQYDPASGHVEYDAFGETINRIDLDAVKPTPFFERVTEIHATIKELPSQATVDIKPNGGGFRLETNNPIGEAQALLTSGPTSSLPDGVFGAKVEDLADRFTVFARVKGLRMVDITTGPGTRIATHAKLASTPFKVEYDKTGLDLDLQLSAIPSDVRVVLDPTAGTVDYIANGGIDTVDATLVSDAPFFDRVKKIALHVEELPDNVTLAYKRPAGDGVRVATTAQIGDAEVLLTSGPPSSLPGGDYGVKIEDVVDRFTAFARVKGLKLVDVLAGPGTRLATHVQLASTPFKVDYAKTGTDLDLALSAIPSDVTAVLDPTAGTVDYVANAGIDTLDATLVSSDPFFDRVKKVVAHAEALPADLRLAYKRPGGKGLLVATDHQIGDASVLLTSGPTATLEPGVYGASIEDIGDKFVAVARVKGLRLVDVLTGPNPKDPVVAKARLASTPLTVRYKEAGFDLKADLSPIPTDIGVTFNPKEGKVDYTANAGIASIRAVLNADAPLFGQVKKVDATVERLPAIVSIGFKPASGSGGSFNATPAVGKIEASLTDGTTLADPLPEGQSGVKLRAVGSQFALFGRLFEVAAASVTSAGSSVDATLATGPLPNGGGRQDLNLDLTFDDPSDAMTTPAHMIGKVHDLPATLALRQSGGETTYKAHDTVPLVELEAHNLPGDDVHGALHEVFATLRDVPKEFKIVHNTFRNGIDANGPFSRIDLEAWDEGPRRSMPQDDGRNKFNLNTRDGRLYIQSRIFGLKKVLLGTIAKTEVETAFGAPPAPLDVVIDGGTTAEPLDVDLGIKDLPISSTFGLATFNGTELTWDAPTAGTDIHMELASKSVGASLDVTDLPASLEVCVGTGFVQCFPKAPQSVRVDPCLTCSVRTVQLYNDFTLVSKASALVRLDGRVCLPRTNDDGDPVPGAVVYGGCQSSTPWRNRLDITNLRLKDMRFEFSGGDSDTKEDGDPVEDDLLKLYVDSDVEGMRLESMGISNEDTEDYMRLQVFDHTPLRNAVVGSPFFWLFDMTEPPSDEDDTPFSGQLMCMGTVAYTSLPFLGLTGVPLAFLETNPITATGDFCADA